METNKPNGRTVHLPAQACAQLDTIRKHFGKKAPLPMDVSDGKLVAMLIKHYMERHYVDDL